MNAIAGGLDDVLNPDGKKYGFALLVFKFDDVEGTVNYISNAGREDMLSAMKAFIKRNEQ